MRGCNPTPTKHDVRRFRALHDLGCIACLINGNRGVPVQIHHIKQGSHRETIGLCPYHHQGIIESVFDKLKGPSLARSKRDFTAEYGTERELLERVDKLIGWDAVCG